ncbi:MAG: hypothetical protein K0Q73_8111, partial [Paenibacillus sp.]|nr:hypothetical protein [Paenibacillus sp.]
QWGNSDRSLGCFVGLNPGSAKLMNPELRLKVERGLNVSGEVLADPSMRQMIAFVESISGADVSGRLSVYNLFYLQDPKARRAVKVLSDLHLESYDLEGEISSIVELQRNPWILVSWGLEDKPHVKDLKQLWLARMQGSGVPYFGKVHAYKKDYYHICPQLVEKRKEIIDDLTSIYSSMVEADRSVYRCHG